MFYSGANNIIHVEVCLLKSECRLEALEKVIETPLRAYIENNKCLMNVSLKIDKSSVNANPDLELINTFLIERDTWNSDDELQLLLSADDCKHLAFHFYYPHHREMELEMFDNEADGDSEAVPSSNHWLLPSSSFVGLWENLIYETGLKEKLLKFALSALTFSQHAVNQNVVCCNRLILVHGPPGTGKTSLCKALAQKLAIRTRPAYRHTHLVEINSHSLFSKWFSESGKLVMRLFSKIREMVMDPKNLVCVLIDEVESIAYARDCMSGQEPRDAMRVVNALLTQLDSIKEHPNVLILATSNLADSIDLAFLDRADIKQYIGLPSVEAIKHIYESMLMEMMRVGIVQEESLQAEMRHEGLLQALAERSIGLSGRTLRKLPFLAHAVHASGSQFGLEEKITLSDFLDAMLAALEKHQLDHELFQK